MESLATLSQPSTQTLHVASIMRMKQIIATFPARLLMSNDLDAG